MKNLFKATNLLLTFMIVISCSNDDSQLEQDLSKNLKVSGMNNVIELNGKANNYSFTVNNSNSKMNLSSDFSNIKFSKPKNNLNNILVTGDNIPFEIELKSHQTNTDGSISLEYIKDGDYSEIITIYNSSFASSDDLLENIPNGMNFSFEDSSLIIQKGCPPCAVVVVGIIAYVVVDHCDTVIQEGVAGCTRMDKCMSVGFCSVECTDCPSNDDEN